MISCDEKHISVLLTRLEHAANRLVCSSYTLHGSFIHAGMTHHVWWSEIIHEKFVLVICDSLCHPVCDIRSTHLWIKVIGRDLRGGNQFAIFAGKLLLNTSVKEESDVGVFLSFSNVTLLETFLAQPLCQDITHPLGWESDGKGI